MMDFVYFGWLLRGMRRLKEENEGLQHFNVQTEGKIEDMVKFYN